MPRDPGGNLFFLRSAVGQQRAGGGAHEHLADALGLPQGKEPDHQAVVAGHDGGALVDGVEMVRQDALIAQGVEFHGAGIGPRIGIVDAVHVLGHQRQLGLHLQGPQHHAGVGGHVGVAGAAAHDDDIALGHRRLSIIDISSQGDQPIFNEDSSLVIVFNGEIYNYKEIREKLVAAGHKFSTNTDTEVLIHGYEQYGEGLLDMLRGMFSFVIWDKNKKELFGARDFFGIKPMYYAQMNGTFMFGSEIKSFLAHPEFKKELNEEALENYLTFQYSPASETFFKNVYKLQPAHYFKLKDGKLTIKKYWDVNFDADNKPSLEQWVNKISDTFHDSVKAHKIADVEVGSFLSSGVDSSYVAAIADVDKTFTVGFGKDEKYNEIGWAKNFSKAIGKENTSKVISPEEYWNSLSMIQYHMDEPLADPSAVALYFVCNIASDKLKVVLSGEGADEIFGGYNVYSDPDGTLYDKLPRVLKRGIGTVASKLPARRGVNFFVRKGKDVE